MPIITLHASGAETATGNGSAVTTAPISTSATWVLDVTAAATLAGDTIDIKVQTQVDDTNWVDVVAFTQVLGNGGAKRYFVKQSATTKQAMFENATALAAGSTREIMGTKWRAAWTEVGTGSFTFSLVGYLDE